MLASFLSVTQNLGYPLLVGVIVVESLGVPVPGETALILGGLAASEGRLSIVAVIALGATATFGGSIIGFLIGRRGGRALLERPGRFYAERQRVLAVGDPFFERHGPKAVFLSRWITGLRVWAAWLAGASSMRWRAFLTWSAIGGAGWATSVSLAAYFGGKGVEHVLSEIGVYGAIVVGVLAVAFAAAWWWRRRHKVAAVEP